MRSFRCLAPLALVLALPALAGDTYKIDPAHSEVGFKVRHIVSRTPGHFSRFEGTIQVDDKDPAKSSVEITIQSASITTDNDSRDKHLRSADFFDVEKFPTLTFRSVGVKDKGDGRLEVTGDFTLHGVTKRITVPVTALGATKDPWGNVRGGWEASFKVNRLDYGVSWNKTLESGTGMLGDEVEISLSFEGVKEAPKAVTAAK
ncbi:MAG TPA: YceI family protein [Holophagaceae bacterium]|nr:YceI family protein [Holophagaceae bacterium]